MAWTTPTALLFAGIIGGLIVLTIWELRAPCTPRRGLLRFATTRGDRYFLGLLAAGFVVLACIGLFDGPGWIAGGLGLGAMAAVGRWA